MNVTLRPTLCGSKNDCMMAAGMNDEPDEIINIADRACEEGDVHMQNVYLPHLKIGKLFAVFTTGAYHYSMSNNNNCMLTTAAVLVNNRYADVIVHSQTYGDILRNNVVYEVLD